MKKMHLLIFIQIFFNWENSFSQSDNFFGSYKFYSKDKMYYQILDLNHDTTFIYTVGNDLIAQKSSGIWKIYGDTLILNSRLQNEKVPATIHETSNNDLQNEFTFINKSQSDDVLGLVLIFKDSVRYIPIFSKKITVNFKNFIAFQLFLTPELATPPYFIKNSISNKFEIYFDTKDIYRNYLFLLKQKFLLRNKCLFKLTNTKIDSILFDIGTRKPIALKKK